MIYGLDIETMPDQVPSEILPQPKFGNVKDPKKIEAIKDKFVKEDLQKKMSLSPHLCQIVSIALWNPENYYVVSQRKFPEKQMLQWFFKTMTSAMPIIKVITQNGRGRPGEFGDCRNLRARGIFHKVLNQKDAQLMDSLWLRKYKEDFHIDLMDHLGCSMKVWAKRYLDIDKEDHGSNMVELVENEDWDTIETYNMKDAKANYLMAERWGLI